MAKIADFGLARAADDESLTQEGVLVGTPLFLAPEQAQGGDVDFRADLFSLGSVLYALCTGHSPFEAPTTVAVLKRVCEDTPAPLRAANPAVPAWLEGVILRLLEKDPTRRFPSAAAVAEALGTGLRPGLRRPARPRRRIVLAAGLVLALAAGLAPLFRASPPTESASPVAPATVPLTPEQELANRPSPADALDRAAIPESLLALIGDGDPARAPAELVAILGNQAFLHRDIPWCVRFSPDGRLLATCTRNSSQVNLWDAATGRRLATLAGHTGQVRKVAFSPEGAFLATAGDDGSAKVWDVQARRVRATLAGRHRGVVCAVAFDPTGTRLVTAGHDHTACLWALPAGEPVRVLAGHTQPLCDVSFSPDGTRIATAARDGTARVWDAATGQELLAFRGHKNNIIHRACFSPDSARLVSCAEEDPVPLVWSAATGVVERELRGGKDSLAEVVWGPNGDRIAGGGGYALYKDNAIRVWDAATGREVRQLVGHAARIECLAFSPDGRRLASGGHHEGHRPDQAFHLWDLETGQPVALPSAGHQGQVHGLAFSPDGTLLASAGEDQTVQVWETATGRRRHRLEGHTSIVWGVAFHPDGKRIVTGSHDGTVRVWDVGSGQPLQTLPHGKPGEAALAVAFSPDGRRLASASFHDSLKLWDTATHRRLDDLGYTGGWCLAYGPDGQTLYGGFEDGSIHAWDAAGQHLSSMGVRRAAPVRGLAIQPQGRWLAHGNHHGDGGVQVWDLPARRQVPDLIGHTHFVLACVWRADGRLLATAGVQDPHAEDTDRTVRLWDMAAYATAPAGTVPGPPRCQVVPFPIGGLRTLALSPEGRYLAVGTGGGLIGILRLAKRGEVLAFPEAAGRPSE